LLGLTDANQDGAFESITGEVVEEIRFAQGEPEGSTNEQCLMSIISDALNDGWHDCSCAFPNLVNQALSAALCELPVEGATGFCGDGVVQPAFGETCEGASCPVDCGPAATEVRIAYEPIEGVVYVGFAERRGALDGEATCESLGGFLAMPNDEVENQAVERVRARIGFDVALGFNDVINEAGTDASAFRRVDDGTPIGNRFHAFRNGEPNDTLNVEDCVVQTIDGWNDVSCGQAFAFVCEFR
jgi:hypothetical protein